MAPPRPVSPITNVPHAALIADDDAIIRDLLRNLLTEAGYTVVTAANGDEALAFAPHLDASLAILDLAMPHGDGLQTCEALRRLPNWQGVPILMLTSHHTDEVLSAARRAGVSGFVCKPFAPSELLQRIERLTGDRVATTAHAQVSWSHPERDDHDRPEHARTAVQWERPPPPEEGECGLLRLYRSIPSAPVHMSAVSSYNAVVVERRHILVAEDENMTREIISHVLTQEGYLVDTVSNGQQALAAIITGRYDLVLMDVRMPVLNGIDATRVIRTLPNSKRNTTIIAMTANAFNLFAQEMKDAGLNGYLMKPVSATALLSCVRQHLGGRVEPEGPPAVDVARILDTERMHSEAMMFAPGAMVRFLGNLLTDVEDVLTRVRGWDASEPQDLRRRLHNLAGIAGTLGCAALSEIARDLEAAETPANLLRNRFVDAARATISAISKYLDAEAQAVDSRPH